MLKKSKYSKERFAVISVHTVNQIVCTVSHKTSIPHQSQLMTTQIIDGPQHQTEPAQRQQHRRGARSLARAA